MTIFILIIIVSLLGLVQHFGLIGYLTLWIQLPMEYHLAIIGFLVLIKLVVLGYKYLPVLRRLIVGIWSLPSKVDSLSGKIDKLNGPFSKKGQNRKFSDTRTIRSEKPVNSGRLLYRQVGSSKLGKSRGWKAVIKRGVYYAQLSAYSFIIKGHINAMASVKGGWAMIKRALCLLPIIGLHTTPSRVRAIFVVLKSISKGFYHNGPKGVCLTLKVNTVILQQSIGGFRVSDITSIGCRVKRTHTGLPRLIPKVHRELIRSGDTGLIRFYLSLFSLYRLIDFNGNYDVKSLSKTIISPANTTSGHASLQGELVAFVPLFWKSLTMVLGMNLRSLNRDLREEHERLNLSPLLKSAPLTANIKDRDQLGRLEIAEKSDEIPTVSSHPVAVIASARALNENSQLRDSVIYFLELIRPQSPVKEIWRRSVAIALSKAPGSDKPASYAKLPLGKLSLKEEAAGKIRVFAMVDAWTQWLLKPLHTIIFDSILVGIDQDGTMDQIKPIKALLSRGTSYLASLDLSAATDRLPIWLQEALLAPLFGSEYAAHWRNLLVNRDYVLNIPAKFHGPGYRVKLRYAVGQPMGALSSWAMLALTHHFIVQFCAYRTGVSVKTLSKDGTAYPVWFPDYAILGDDIVIANKLVADQYLKVMKTLGVGIGLHKSLISGKGVALEFAKRTFYKGVDVSPISFSEIQMAFSSPAGAVEFIKKYSLTLQAFLKAAGYGYRVLGGLNRPLGTLNSKVRLLILALNMPVTVEEINNFFTLGQPRAGVGLIETLEVIDIIVSRELSRMKKALNALRYSLYSLELFHVRAKFIASVVDSMQIENKALGMNYILPLVKEIMFQTQIFAKGVALTTTDQISGQLTYLMLNRYELTAAQLFEGMIALQKMVANLPIASLSYVRVLPETTSRAMSDTIYIRLWKSLSGILQGTKTVPPVRFGIGPRSNES